MSLRILNELKTILKLSKKQRQNKYKTTRKSGFFILYWFYLQKNLFFYIYFKSYNINKVFKDL